MKQSEKDRPAGLVARLGARWRNASLKWRIFAAFAVFTGVVLVVLWLFQVVLFNRFYEDTKRKELTAAAQTIQQNIAAADLDSVVQRVSRGSQIYAVVMDSSGRPLATSDYSPNRFESSIRDQLMYVYWATAERGGEYMEVMGGARRDPAPRGIAYAVIRQDDRAGAYMVFLYTVLTPLNATVRTNGIQLLWITAILLLVALLVALFLSRRVSAPLAKLRDAANVLATGDYGVHFEEQGYREVAQLGHALNYAAAELGQVERLQRDLVANISHDLRTPLTMICGYAEIMRDLPGENTPENVQVIIDEAKRLTSLVNDTLDLSKLQSGTQKLERTRFNLTANLRSILRRYDKLTGYTLTLEADKDVLVCADELKISQVVYNLINNALTYTGKDHCIRLTQAVAGGQVRVEVSDTGEGIPEDKLQDIWKRYYKVDKNHKRAQVGTGLGLSIVKAVLDMHGGTYGVRSALGQGSTFWFTLPVEEELPHGLPESELDKGEEEACT